MTAATFEKVEIGHRVTGRSAMLQYGGQVHALTCTIKSFQENAGVRPFSNVIRAVQYVVYVLFFVSPFLFFRFAK